MIRFVRTDLSSTHSLECIVSYTFARCKQCVPKHCDNFLITFCVLGLSILDFRKAHGRRQLERSERAHPSSVVHILKGAFSIDLREITNVGCYIWKVRALLLSLLLPNGVNQNAKGIKTEAIISIAPRSHDAANAHVVCFQHYPYQSQCIRKHSKIVVCLWLLGNLLISRNRLDMILFSPEKNMSKTYQW